MQTEGPITLSSTVLEEAEHHISGVFAPHDLCSHDGRALDFKIRYLQSRHLTLGHLRYGADVELDVPAVDAFYHLNLTLRGMTQVSQGKEAAETVGNLSGAMFSPRLPRTVRWSADAIQHAIRIPKAGLEGHLSALIGCPVDAPLGFALRLDMSSPSGQSLLSAVTHMRSELSRPDGVASTPLLRAQLETYVLSQLLFTAPHRYTDALTQGGRPAYRRHVTAALDYIESHLADPLTGPDIARAVNVSVRALQSGFADEVGMSPMSYVRDRRLDCVHKDLVTRAGCSVQQVAARWGFFHLGRFAMQYRHKFGVLPSETVRRSQPPG